MALILNLETSTKNCSVSIGKNGQCLCVVEEYSENYSHAEKLHQFILFACEGAEIELSDLDGVCVSRGPGSYTGLRIGVSAAKGFCFGLKIPLLSLTSLEIIAQKHRKEGKRILPMLDARRMEIYTCSYDSKGKLESEIEAKIIAENSWLEMTEPTLLVGEGVDKCQKVLDKPNFTYLVQPPSAKDMLVLSEEKFKESSFEDVAYFEPFYLKEFQTGPKKNK